MSDQSFTCSRWFPAICDPMDCSLSAYSWNFLGKSTGVNCHFLLQGMFANWDWTSVSCVSWICRQILYHWATWEALRRSLLWDKCITIPHTAFCIFTYILDKKEWIFLYRYIILFCKCSFLYELFSVTFTLSLSFTLIFSIDLIQLYACSFQLDGYLTITSSGNTYIIFIFEQSNRL